MINWNGWQGIPLIELESSGIKVNKRIEIKPFHYFMFDWNGWQVMPFFKLKSSDIEVNKRNETKQF